MPIRTAAWPEGTPAWVDLMAKDFEATKRFYGELFGWEFTPGAAEFGYYSTATLNQHAVAGVSPTPPGMEDRPSAWATYLAVDDLEAAQARVTRASGTVIMPALQIGAFGAMAVLADPTGAAFGLWQSGSHTGVDVYNEPGALAWNEVLTGDYAAARGFYADVFGYTYTDLEDGVPYATIEIDGTTVGGIGDLSLTGAAGPAHWRSSFGTADLRASCARAARLGATVVAEPWRTPFGTAAAVSGPSGEVLQLNQPAAS